MQRQIFYLFPSFHRYSSNPTIDETIHWLLEQGLPPIPIAPWHSHTKGDYYNNAGPGEPPQDKFTGKNPSFLSRYGNPILVNHRLYQERMPNGEELRHWFQDRRTGIATMGGWRNVVWVDVDAKLFVSLEDCQAQVERWIERYRLEETYIERTGRGGYHIALKLPDAGAVGLMRFGFADAQTNTDSVVAAGEVLGRGVPVVLAPTEGVVGPYRCLHRGMPLRVESLEAVGLRLVGVKSGAQNCSKQLWFRTQNECSKSSVDEAWSRRPLLQKLLRQSVLDLLNQCYQMDQGQRSDVMTAIAHEAIGWQNWLQTHGYPPPMPDAATFLMQVGKRMGLDQARVERILDSSSNGVPVVQSLPGLHFYQGDQGCEARLRRVWRG